MKHTILSKNALISKIKLSVNHKFLNPPCILNSRIHQAIQNVFLSSIKPDKNQTRVGRWLFGLSSKYVALFVSKSVAT